MRLGGMVKDDNKFLDGMDSSFGGIAGVLGGIQSRLNKMTAGGGITICACYFVSWFYSSSFFIGCFYLNY